MEKNMLRNATMMSLLALTVAISACDSNDDDSATTTTATAGGTDATAGVTDATTNGMVEDGTNNPVQTATVELDSAAAEGAEDAAGEGSFDVDTETGAISGSVTVSGTSGEPTMAHIHQGAVGATGPVLITLVGTENNTVWTVPDGETLDAPGIAAFEAEELYVNVHTEANPDGELRAQLVADPAATDGATAGATTDGATDDATTSGEAVGSLTISFTNTSETMPMTPPVVALHNAPDADNGIRLFEESQPAILEIIEIAENGDNGPLVALAGSKAEEGRVSAAGVALTDAENPGPLLPGTSSSIDLDLANEDQVLSIVSMIACSNDGFSGIDSRPLSAEASETFTAPIYDAGSETNVTTLDYWVEDCGGMGNRGDDEDGAIMLHPGQSGSENPDFDFEAGAELLEITVTRN